MKELKEKNMIKMEIGKCYGALVEDIRTIYPLYGTCFGETKDGEKTFMQMDTKTIAKFQSKLPLIIKYLGENKVQEILSGEIFNVFNGNDDFCKYDDDLLSNSECEKEYFETVLNKFEGNALTVFLDNDDKGNAEIYELNDDFKKVYVEKVLCNEESIINIINTSKIGSNNFFANELKVCMDITHNLAKLDDEIIKRSKKL